MWQGQIPHRFAITSILLPTRSEEREVLGVGSFLVAILPSCQYVKILHYCCTDVNSRGERILRGIGIQYSRINI